MSGSDTTTLPAKNKGGRPKGYPKSGGRKKKISDKERIIKEADPIGYLIDIVNGKRILGATTRTQKKNTYVKPLMDERYNAAIALAKKVLPDMKAVEGKKDDWVSEFSKILLERSDAERLRQEREQHQRDREELQRLRERYNDDQVVEGEVIESMSQAKVASIPRSAIDQNSGQPVRAVKRTK